MESPLLATVLVVIIVVLGGSEGFSVRRVAESYSGDEDSASTVNGTRVTDTLQHIVVMSRHGNRASSVDYPNDPYPLGDVTYWPYGVNQLTNKGRHEVYNLGKRLRSLYNGFLNSTYSTSNVISKSDEEERVIYSGQLVLQGLFPPEGFQVWDNAMNWQPVVLYTNASDHCMEPKNIKLSEYIVFHEETYVLTTYNWLIPPPIILELLRSFLKLVSSCGKFKSDKSEVYSVFEEENNDKISTILTYFQNYSNETYDADDLSYFFEKIYSEVNEGYSLSTELAEVYPQPFTDFYVKNFQTRCAGTDEMVRLVIGNIYEEVLDMMKSKINGSNPDLKMNFYSAHDCSIICLQVALGMARESVISWVKVGSALVIELHKDSNDEYYLQVIYIDGSSLDSDPVSLSLPDCGEPCYYDALVNSTLAFTDVNFEEECLT